ncbi:MAG: hypothetical protein Q7S16_00215 [bacterium]|nr:hypothetical protein [bacterium]
MLIINLLSPEKQRLHAIRVVFHRTKTILELTLILACCIAIITIGTKYFLVQTVLTFATTPTTNIHTRELEIAVRKTNKTTALLDRLQKDTTPWSTFFIHLSNAMPESITITEMTVNKKATPQFILKGKAATRSDLLTFKTALEQLPFITNLSFPLTNLLSPKDINWQLESNINTSAL